MQRAGPKVQAQALALLRRHDRPLTAYQILDCVAESGTRLAPQTIYRALKALVARGEAHRVESMGAYVACRCAAHRDAAILSICEGCGVVEEHLDARLLGALASVAGRSGFVPQRQVIELHGRCGACRHRASA